MKEPQLAARLGDPKMETWDNMYRQDIHVMVLLADSGKDRLLQELQTILAQTEKFIVKKTADHLPIKKADDILFVQKGEALRNRDGFSIEHFGYVDGISQPRFLKGETEPGKRWNDIIWRKAVLVEDKVPGYQNCFGSFLVFRKLEQNVQRFRQAIDELAALLSPGEVNEEAKKLAGAYVVGRFSNGTPVVKHPAEIPVRPGEEVDNDFDYKYDATATKCPFHAHTRVVCPRDIDPAQWLRRIVRRGIPYDEAGRNNDMAWFPSQDVGLLFMCYQANIFLQFETLQATWANDGKVGEFKKVGIDSIAGQGAMNAQPQQWPAKWDKDDKLNGFSFPSTVTLKGGEYFFAPSIPFLRHLPPF
jgi:Dyp-type peroxidase family